MALLDQMLLNNRGIYRNCDWGGGGGAGVEVEVGVNLVSAKGESHYRPRGVWGHAPPGKV